MMGKTCNHLNEQQPVMTLTLVLDFVFSSYLIGLVLISCLEYQ